MNRNFYISLCGLFLLSGCGEKSIVTHTFFIQAIPDSAVLTSMIKAMTPVINEIVKEELGLAKDFDFDFFLPKNRQAVTLYYVNDIYENGETDLFSALNNMAPNWQNLVIHNVTFTPKLDFFGEEKDELVILVNDSDKQLSQLNREIKEIVHQVNMQYKQKYHHDLYDIAKSEHYHYTPHINVGRLRSHSIKLHIKDDSQVDKVFGRIKQRTKKAVGDIVQKLLTKDNQKLSFTMIFVFDMQKKARIKEYALKVNY